MTRRQAFPALAFLAALGVVSLLALWRGEFGAVCIAMSILAVDVWRWRREKRR